jgi:hypothetical protein
MIYSSFGKQQKLFENWRKFLKESKFNEAIVDVVADKLSDIFDDQGKLVSDVSSKLLDGINKAKAWVSSEFPNLNITEAFVVGAAVTYQYGPGSDIDVSLVIPGMDSKQQRMIDKWLEKNLAFPNFQGPEGSSRPYQFKPMENNLGYENVDAAYDPVTEEWLKKPDIEQAKQMYNQKMGAGSREQKAYAKVEANLKKHFKELLDVLNSTQNPDEILQASLKTYQRKDSLKSVRSQAFKSTEQGYVSQNWGFGNVIYKMLDRDGYLEPFDLIKKMKKDNSLAADQGYIQKLKSSLEKALADELGFHGANYTQAAE